VNPTFGRSQGSLFDADDEAHAETLTDVNEELERRTLANSAFAGRSLILGCGPQSPVVAVVGESPGTPDIQSGIPFMGPVGDLLNIMISSIGLKRNQCFLTNTVKIVSGGDEMTKDTLAFFVPFLFRELNAVKPALIISLGNTPTHALLQTRKPISVMRGEFQSFNGIKVMPTYNPAYLLRDPSRKKEAWEDLKKIRAAIQSLVEIKRIHGSVV
jgi:uracil-DNA glycosylase family 4